VTGVSWHSRGWQKERFFTILWRLPAGFFLAYLVAFAWIILALQLTPLPPEVAVADHTASGLDPQTLLLKI